MDGRKAELIMRYLPELLYQSGVSALGVVGVLYRAAGSKANLQPVDRLTRLPT